MTEEVVYERGVRIGRALHPFDPSKTATEVEQDAADSAEEWMRVFRLGIAAGIREDAHLEAVAR